MADYPLSDWTPVQPFPFMAARRIFTGATTDEGLVDIKYFRQPDGELAAVAFFGPQSEGAPGQVHGGMILTVLDEALGAAAWVRGHSVLTVRLDTRFRLKVPVGTQLLVETKILKTRHRLLFVEGTLMGRAGEVYATADGEFLEVDREAFNGG